MDPLAALARRPRRAHAVRPRARRRAGVSPARARPRVGTPGTVAAGGAAAGADGVRKRRARQGRDAGRPARRVDRAAEAGPPIRIPRAAGPARPHGHRCRVAGLRHGRVHLLPLAARSRDPAAAAGGPRSGLAVRRRRAAVLPGLRAHPRAGRRHRSGHGLPGAGAVHRRRRRRYGGRRARLRSSRLARLLRGPGRRAGGGPAPCPRDRWGRLGDGGRRQRTVLETPARCRSGCRRAHAAGERPGRNARGHSRERIPGRVSDDSGGDLRAGDRRRARAGG